MDRPPRKIIRADGTELLLPPRPHGLQEIYRHIGCDTIDVVQLRHLGHPALVMLVDDEGHLKGKPVNAKATELYWKNCLTNTTHQIRGDVAIVPDEDFAS